MKAPILIGYDVTNITGETYEILSNKEVIAVNQDPLGVQGRKVQTSGLDGCQQVWAGPLSGHRLTVVLWNHCSKAATITSKWDALGLESGTTISVRDLWQHKDLEADSVASFGAHIDAHNCATYIFTPKTVSHAESYFIANIEVKGGIPLSSLLKPFVHLIVVNMGGFLYNYIDLCCY